MTVLHRPGIKHGNADGLSRIPDEYDFCDCYRAGSELSTLPCGGCRYCSRAQQQWSRFNEDVDYVVPLTVKSATVKSTVGRSSPWITGYSHDQLVESQRSDPCLGKLITWLSTGGEPMQKDLFLCSPTVKYFFNCRKRLVCQNGLLLYKWEEVSGDRLLLMVPEKLKNEVISYNHDLPLTGHMGIVKTIARVKQSFMWYGLTKDVELYVKSCTFCNKNKRASVKAKAALGQYHAGSLMERVHVDILGPFTPSSQGNQYVLMLVDQFTKWLECYPLPDQTAESVAKCVVDGFISRFGCPLEIHTDQGKNFDGKLFLSVCELLQIAKTRTTPYHPCSNGQVERYNRTLLQLIRCFLKGNQQDWDQYLQQLAGAIRSTVNRQTGFTPNLMMLGREVMLPVHLLIGEIETQGLAPAEYVKRLRSVLRNVHTLARDKLESSQCRQKCDYDLRLKTNTYEPGDIVYQLDSAKKVGVVNYGRCGKVHCSSFMCRNSCGPW